MVGEGFLTTLSKSLEEGKVTLNQIDQACYRILAAKYKLGLFDDPYRYCDSNRAKTEIFTEKTRKFARETATKSFVLLKNENQTLPLQRKGTIAVIGPMAANKENMIGTWSVAAIPSQAVSLLEGIKNVVNEKTKIVYALGSNVVEDSLLDKRINIFGKPTYFDLRSQDELIKEALNVAGESDVIIAAMGESAEMSGESSSRTDIALPGNQQKLLMALLATGKPVIMVLFTGRPLTLNWEDKNIPAILNVWFAGSEAGNAISDVLFGLANPSGKLSMTFPQNVGQIPLYYNHKNTGRPLEENGWFTKFRSNYLDVSNDPLYPFGYGLSYTTFEYGNFHSSSKRLKGNQTLTIDFDLTNSGNYDGAEVVQMYIRDLVGNITHPVKELKGFQKVYLKKGETKRVVFKITPENLKFYNNELIFDWESGEFVAMIGGNSRDTYAVSFHWEK
jgi:beta-glucosidase